ncbi:MAG: hypothetical protein SFW67_03345 [Myxococcaceae bacterium]|nr:hypothetical protein [Myxococcaceae bacterium]
MGLALLLCLAQLSPPPLFPSDVPLEAPPPPAPAPKKPLTEADPTTALHFAPLSLFATHLSFEVERAVTRTVTLFGAIGGSLILQAGLELGGRVYLGERALDGPFLSLQGTVFYFSQTGTLLVGPAGLFGYTFSPRGRFVLSVGAGLQLWYQPTTDQGATFLGVAPHADVVFLPGMQRPTSQGWAPQPVVRFTVGPAF